MQITGQESNQVIQEEIGKRIRDNRIAAGYSQSEAAERAGIAVNTLARLEKGENVALANVLSILRALGNLSNVELLIPEQSVRVTDIVDERKKPQRVSRKRHETISESWVWGEDREK